VVQIVVVDDVDGNEVVGRVVAGRAAPPPRLPLGVHIDARKTRFIRQPRQLKEVRGPSCADGRQNSSTLVLLLRRRLQRPQQSVGRRRHGHV
jgi:hypothetical protein